MIWCDSHKVDSAICVLELLCEKFSILSLATDPIAQLKVTDILKALQHNNTTEHIVHSLNKQDLKNSRNQLLDHELIILSVT